jgi:hypothetical protein
MTDLAIERPISTWWRGDGDLCRGVHLVRGAEPILRMRSMLLEFSERCDQPGTMEDLPYFLSKPGLLKRVPCLFLLAKRQDLRPDELLVDDLLGALFLYEFRVLGQGLKAFASNDRSGRGTLLAPPPQRMKVAGLVSRALLDRGAHMIMLSFRRGGGENDSGSEGDGTGLFAGLFKGPGSSSIRAEWARRERQIAGYLPLLESYDATLATMGHRTRRNLRYYRRRAETQLGCTLVSPVAIGPAEILAFNRVCMYPVRDQVALWRLNVMQELSQPVMLGLKDKDGRWLSLLGARRNHDRAEILWQMNRDGLRSYSLSTVMRSYLIEHEIAHAMRRLSCEGGTPHSVNHSFVREELTDLVVVRRSLVASVMKGFARHWVYADNKLALVLKDKDIRWHPC